MKPPVALPVILPVVVWLTGCATDPLVINKPVYVKQPPVVIRVPCIDSKDVPLPARLFAEEEWGAPGNHDRRARALLADRKVLLAENANLRDMLHACAVPEQPIAKEP